jgi:hypothetical protein
MAALRREAAVTLAPRGTPLSLPLRAEIKVVGYLACKPGGAERA